MYALLREALKKTEKVAIADVVIRTRQHLAVLLPEDDILVLNTLRFADEIRTPKDMEVAAPSAKSAGLAAKEVSMAEKLIEEMSGPWKPEQYRDTYRDDLMKRINEKVRNKETHTLTEAEKGGGKPAKSAEIIDLMEVLKKSLSKGHPKLGRRKSAKA